MSDPAALCINTPFAQQSPDEALWLLRHIHGSSAILEVGSCVGEMLKIMALACVKGAKIRSIDLGVLPEEAGPMAGFDVVPHLAVVAETLTQQGFDVHVCIANSHDKRAIEWAKDQSPDGYDFVFIDGDHTYEGVKADWEAYRSLAPMIGFHDIAHPDCGVAQLWNEIKASGLKTEECVASHMGIGLVWPVK